MKSIVNTVRALLVLTIAQAFAVDVARLTPATWDEFVPQGKEVDAIYGDFVLRNSRIVAVIAEPLATRNANMTVRSVGGMIIDLTKRDEPNDQLSCYYANGMPLQCTSPEKVRIRVGTEEMAAGPDLKATAKRIEWSTSTTSASKLEVTVRYILEDGRDWLVAETLLKNPNSEPITQELSDLIRADKTFEFGSDDAVGLFWANDEWFQQGYGVVVEGRTLKRSGQRNQVLAMIDKDGNSKVTVKPGETYTISRKIFPGSSLLEVRSIANRLANIEQTSLPVIIRDSNGPIANAQLALTLDGQPYGTARSKADGSLSIAIPPKKFGFTARAIGRPQGKTAEIPIKLESASVELRLKECGYVAGQITDEKGGQIPCKVSFQGKEGTESPDFGPDTADTAVKNIYYSHDGKFRQEIGPGTYDVVISYGPEYDAIFTELVVEPGKVAPLKAQLKRVLNTTGWVSADFHSHSTPSGDNTSSQLGRVQNLLCENVEFCPCTEHNRIDSYTPLLKRLGVERLMGTCTGMELTGSLLPINHQNAFPLIHKPRTQDGGAPQTDDSPVVQIERLAMWDGGSDKLVQENHPNLVQLFSDKDEDGKYDGGFAKMLQFMDVMEIHPPEGIFSAPTRGENGKLTRNPIFHWMQLVNLGYRIPGVVNTDAHYTYHDSGWLRNYIKSATDDPAKVDTMDVVNHSEQGHVVVTTGPFMEVSLKSHKESKKGVGIPGDDVIAPGGEVELHVKVQCANWLDVNRVQVFLNGRPDKSLNFTRRETPEKFQPDVVKFEATLPIDLKADTHVIVATIGEGLQLGRVMGPERGKIPPVAVSNPIFVDVDGQGFKSNGDLLDLPFPK